MVQHQYTAQQSIWPLLVVTAVCSLTAFVCRCGAGALCGGAQGAGLAGGSGAAVDNTTLIVSANGAGRRVVAGVGQSAIAICGDLRFHVCDIILPVYVISRLSHCDIRQQQHRQHQKEAGQQHACSWEPLLPAHDNSYLPHYWPAQQSSLK